MNFNIEFVPQRFDDDSFSSDDITPYDLTRVGWVAKTNTDKILRILFGIIIGIICDGEISPEEVKYLTQWRYDHSDDGFARQIRPIFAILDDVLSKGQLTLNEALQLLEIIHSQLTDSQYNMDTLTVQILLGMIQGVMADDVITPAELDQLAGWMRKQNCQNSLFDFIRQAVEQTRNHYNKETHDALMKALKDYVFFKPGQNAEVKVTFQDKRFVLSGRFAFGSKKELGEQIIARMGIICKAVASTTDYLVVGGTKSVLWKYENYGLKYEAARKLQKSGFPIQIIGEGDLIASLD